MRVADKILKYLLETDTVSDKERWQVYSLDIANALGVKEAKIVPIRVPISSVAAFKKYVYAWLKQFETKSPS